MNQNELVIILLKMGLTNNGKIDKPIKLKVGSKLVDLIKEDIRDNGDYIIIGQ